MNAYGRKLVTLLNNQWKEPHAFSGRWIVKGETLGWRGTTRSRRTQYPSRDP